MKSFFSDYNATIELENNHELHVGTYFIYYSIDSRLISPEKKGKNSWKSKDKRNDITFNSMKMISKLKKNKKCNMKSAADTVPLLFDYLEKF